MHYHTIAYHQDSLPEPFIHKQITDFLSRELGEFGDPAEDIAMAIDHALSCRGGFVLVARKGSDTDPGDIIGAVVINVTGMKSYVPANLLVYIATDATLRGKGIGSALMKEVIERCEDGIALHCEPHNPARRLYEKFGFTSKYLSMRYTK